MKLPFLLLLSFLFSFKISQAKPTIQAEDLAIPSEEISKIQPLPPLPQSPGNIKKSPTKGDILLQGLNTFFTYNQCTTDDGRFFNRNESGYDDCFNNPHQNKNQKSRFIPGPE